MEGIIVVLGAPNDEQGQLSIMALNRLQTGLRFYRHNQDFKFLCTGGFGPHFNTTNQPHAYYAAQYLISQGVPTTNILPYVLSRHTVEDASLVQPLLAQHKSDKVVVVTSDFHMPRAALLFNKYVTSQYILFLEAVSTLDAATLVKLQKHERNALAWLQQQPDFN
ncbi:MAG: YdcF family protein [Adhaeribacter sp.]